jgi:hypothetical protein
MRYSFLPLQGWVVGYWRQGIAIIGEAAPRGELLFRPFKGLVVAGETNVSGIVREVAFNRRIDTL